MSTGKRPIFVSFVCANESSGLWWWQGGDGEWERRAAWLQPIDLAASRRHKF